jgi:hypothetical protein
MKKSRHKEKSKKRLTGLFGFISAVYRFHFEYRHTYESIDELRWWYDSEDEVDYDDEELNEMAMDNIVSNYEFGFYE